MRPVLWILFFALPAAAQSYGPPLGDLRLSFDSAAPLSHIYVPQFSVFDVYVSVEIDFGTAQANAGNGLLIWEGSLGIPPELILLSAEHVPEIAFCDGCSDVDWRALLVRCVFAKNTPSLLMHLELQLMQDLNDLEITLGPASPGNFDGLAPGWRDCTNSGNDLQELHPFTDSWTNSLWVNTTVGMRELSWGGVKGRF